MAQAAIVSALTEKFTSLLVEKFFQEVSLITAFGQDLEFICDELNTFKDILNKATLLTDSRDESISSLMSTWLNKVEEFLTDAEYIVEECAAASNFKLRYDPIFRYTMGREIKGLKDRIRNIQWSSKHFKEFLSVLDVNDRRQTSNKSEDKDKSSSDVTEKNPLGMKKQIDKISDLILQKDGPRSIAILGMGGSGKTLLLQHVFNNERVCAAPDFDHRVWLPISQKFETRSLLERICKQIKPGQLKFLSDLDESERKKKMMELLKDKRCLIALDDVWDNKVLETIGLKLESQHKIVITTRENRVAADYSEKYQIRQLSEDDSWKLFCIHAFPDSDGHIPPEELSDVAKRVEEKCCGVPLVIKAIGGYMARRSIPNVWESTLKNLEAEHLQAEAMSNKVMPCLRLSYQALPSHLKPCFLYFSSFPKNTEIETDYLVYAWISEGIVPTREDAYNVGRLYINELIDRCLVEGSDFGGDGRAKLCKMHDLLHDLADSIGQPKRLLKKQSDELLVEEYLRRCRISFIKNNITKILEPIQSPRLRTLLLSDNGDLKSISASFFNNLRYLRVLDLSKTSIRSLPRSIVKINHVRFMNLSGTNIEMLPESLSDLRHLIFLDVSNCKNLKWLHRGIGKNKFMVHLNVEGCTDLKQLPVGISKLVSLQTLKGVAFKYAVQSTDFKKLEGWPVPMSKLVQALKGVKFNKENAVNANALQLRDLKGLTLLEQLSLNIDEDPSLKLSGETFRAMTKMRTLSIRNSSFNNVLCLPQDMESMKGLEIVRLYKCALPEWMFDLKNLMELELHVPQDCSADDYKGLVNIPNLRKLRLTNFKVHFPEEFGAALAFPKLEELILESSDLNTFPLLKIKAMPKLKRVRLQECLNLQHLQHGHWQILKDRKVQVQVQVTEKEVTKKEVT